MTASETSGAKALSPLDGRYRAHVAALADHFSEWALFEYRLRVELEWLLFVTSCEEIPEARALSPAEQRELRSWMTGLSEAEFQRIKAIEATTRHDVKALEYYVKERLAKTSMADVREFVHFCCTSEDINNLAYAMMLRDGMRKVWLPAARRLVDGVRALAERTRDEALLSRTHGQPATPTTLGKELAVFVHRWDRQLAQLERAEFLGKFNGTVGNFSAHVAAYPDAPWEDIARTFVEHLGLRLNPLTTQIEPHDWMAEVFHGLIRFDTIAIDFCRDAWAYVSFGYFRQRIVAGEVGSSVMPHKVNPIDFENGEANFGIANELLDHLARKLPVSRLQRDLTDSSAMRNLGVALGHSLLALQAAARGVDNLEVDAAALRRDLDGAWQVLAEAVQTVMRRAGLPDPYERMKALTRGAAIAAEDIQRFIRESELDERDKQALLALTPATYTGLARQLVRWILPGRPAEDTKPARHTARPRRGAGR